MPPTGPLLSADLCSCAFASCLCHTLTNRVPVSSLPDRVVDDLNPMLNFTRKEVENLLHFVEKEPAPQASLDIKGIKEPVLQLACRKYPHLITKVRARGARSHGTAALSRGGSSGELVFLRTFVSRRQLECRGSSLPWSGPQALGSAIGRNLPVFS